MPQLLRKFVKAVRIARYPGLLAELRHGVAAAVEHRGALGGLRLKTIVDAGANVGQFSLIASELHPGARIFAFEPLPAAADTYERVMGSRLNGKMFRHALGAQAGHRTLHVAGRNDSSSLLPISSLQVAMHPQTAEVAQIAVEVRPLADVLSQDDLTSSALLKIDVQGTELEVLKGCGPLLCRFDHLYIELGFFEFYVGQPLAHQVIAMLADRGFLLSGVYNVVYDSAGRAAQADFLFRRA